MFNISFGEISIVLIVAALFFGVDECKAMLKFFKKTQNKAQTLRTQINKEMQEIEDEINEESSQANENTTTIIDINGNLQTAYSLQNIEDKLQKPANSKEIDNEEKVVK